MANRFRVGANKLASRLIQFGSETVTYTRGYDRVDVQAVLGSKKLKISDQDGIRVEWTDMDFLILVSDLAFDGVRIEPKRGDIIFLENTTDGTVQTYEVAPYANEPPWRWADSFKQMYRIHANRLDEQPI